MTASSKLPTSIAASLPTRIRVRREIFKLCRGSCLGFLWLLGMQLAVGVSQAQPMNVGPDGLASVSTVPLLGGKAKLLNVAADAGYGFTEGVLRQGDRHHRANLGVAAGLSPIEGWSGSLQLGGRYDAHKLGSAGRDSGIVIRPRLSGRGVMEVLDGFFLGGQLALQPGPTFSPGKAISGLAVDLDALAGTVQGPLQLSGRLGFRYDRGRHAVDNANTLSLADRLALGVSDAPQVRLGVGGLYALMPMLSLLSEVTWDVSVGKKAVAALDGPLWLRVGARMPLGEQFQIGLLAGVSPSGRPNLQPTGALAQVDPRLYIGLTLAATAIDGSEPVTKAPEEIEEQPPRLIVTVTGLDAMPLVGARVQAGSESCTTGDDGSCSLIAAATEPRSLHVESAGYAPADQSYGASDADQQLAVALSALPVTLQGQLLNDKGAAVEGARISILRGDRQFDGITDAQGNFTIADLETGPAVLRIEAEGLPASEQEIVVEPNPLPLSLTTQLDTDRQATGQIRGTVRTFDGAPVAATLTITPKKREVQCDDKGEFAVDVPAGKYRVTVKAPGYSPQRRTAVVESRGVTVLVIELTAKK